MFATARWLLLPGGGTHWGGWRRRPRLVRSRHGRGGDRAGSGVRPLREGEGASCGQGGVSRTRPPPCGVCKAAAGAGDLTPGPGRSAPEQPSPCTCLPALCPCCCAPERAVGSGRRGGVPPRAARGLGRGGAAGNRVRPLVRPRGTPGRRDGARASLGRAGRC